MEGRGRGEERRGGGGGGEGGREGVQKVERRGGNAWGRKRRRRDRECFFQIYIYIIFIFHLVLQIFYICNLQLALPCI